MQQFLKEHDARNVHSEFKNSRQMTDCFDFVSINFKSYNSLKIIANGATRIKKTT